MQKLLLDNLSRAQAFDNALMAPGPLDEISARTLTAIMFNPATVARNKAINDLATKYLQYFRASVQPAARELGFATAKKVLSGMTGGLAADLNKPELRARILTDAALRDGDRLRIVQTIVNDKTNTLENRLAAYWLEPGQNVNQKLQYLKQLHTDMEGKRLEYDKRLIQYNRGELPKRPPKPRLDYLDKMTEDVKQGMREQARRTGTDAETVVFTKAGIMEFAWVTVNASEACPDCRGRQGIRGDAAFWDQHGRPGAGKTVCGTACFCMLVPAAVVQQNPELEGGLNTHTNVMPTIGVHRLTTAMSL